MAAVTPGVMVTLLRTTLRRCRQRIRTSRLNIGRPGKPDLAYSLSDNREGRQQDTTATAGAGYWTYKG